MNSRTLIALIKQLAALAVLHQSTHQGYSTTNNGLQNIGGLTNAEYQLHATYFNSLEKVNPALLSYFITNQPTSNENNVDHATSRLAGSQSQLPIHP
jgi:hypothetical protein